MNQLLDSLYNILCYITEDMVAHGLNNLPPELNKMMNDLAISLGDYLDKNN